MPACSTGRSRLRATTLSASMPSELDARMKCSKSLHIPTGQQNVNALSLTMPLQCIITFLSASVSFKSRVAAGSGKLHPVCCTTWLHSLAAQSGCTIWLHNLAAQSGCTTWLHNLAAQSGCTVWLHSLAAQSGCTIWPHNLAAQSGCTVWLHLTVHGSVHCMHMCFDTLVTCSPPSMDHHP